MKKQFGPKILSCFLSWLLMIQPFLSAPVYASVQSDTDEETDTVWICKTVTDTDGNNHNEEVRVPKKKVHKFMEEGAFYGRCDNGGKWVNACILNDKNPETSNHTYIREDGVRDCFKKKSSYLGNCDQDEVQICYIPEGKPDQMETIKIKKNALKWYLKRGSKFGHCPGSCDYKVAMCDVPSSETDIEHTISVCIGDVKARLEQGDYLGACNSDREKITICHIPKGNPDNKHSITISKNALRGHLKHGDYIGECQNTDIGYCGDGNVDEGEQCDDAGESSRCNTDCTYARCGDGILNPTSKEACDLGVNNSNTGSCLLNCQIAICGDGYLQAGVEECDDHGASNRCNSNCTYSRCGDGILNTFSGEECDDGNNTDGDGCSKDCKREFVCGNGTLEPGEECDLGTQNSINGACLPNCKNNTCGDGYLYTGKEECDDGSANAFTSACLPTCKINICGDGYVEYNVEECDLGNNNSDTGACLKTCKKNVCGDGYLYTNVEECDDGNSDNTDGCSTKCKLATCGDGYVYSGVEECDSGKLGGDSTCYSNCTLVKISTSTQTDQTTKERVVTSNGNQPDNRTIIGTIVGSVVGAVVFLGALGAILHKVMANSVISSVSTIVKGK